MGDVIKLAKMWAVVAMGVKAVVAVAILIVALSFAFGDGGRFSVEWKPNGVTHER